MPSVDIVVETPASQSVRARQVCSMFDVPRVETSRVEIKGSLPLHERPWSVGLIVGPSGCGKSTILRDIFGGERSMEWGAASVVDDVGLDLSVEDVTGAFSAVGFNTIPAWLRPYHVLSNGERFRVEMARRLLEADGPVVVDEFTSVVDRQVAQVASHAVQKFVRRKGLQLVAASCHYDIIDWLQPDWTFEPSTSTFGWRCLQRRPEFDVEFRRVPYSEWRRFAPFHYMSADLHKSARCFALHVHDRPVVFAATIHRPHAKRHDIWGVSRHVALPDWQGIGLGPQIIDIMARLYKAVGRSLRIYPAHPPLVRVWQKSSLWRQVKKAGTFSTGSTGSTGKMGGRPCAVFEYVGPAHDDRDLARRLVC